MIIDTNTNIPQTATYNEETGGTRPMRLDERRLILEKVRELLELDEAESQ